MAAGPTSEVRYQARRLRVTVEMPFDEFRKRYEAAVPVYDPTTFGALVERGADWSEMVALMDRSAPHGFLRYWGSDVEPLMTLAGDPGPCAVYLMGNHVIIEEMYRYDPDAFMYAPLRPVISSRSSGSTQFSIDQPSLLFASFGDDRITKVGVELDRKVAALLRHLGAPVPPALAG
ncbi:hypothetical protein OG799_16805 [Micromonospora sp. NBC_00898]|uniref:hypothetical protein n=1 Tax=Micromonospora sp. NBC_00898 TaxID=2975981 RepID=UPI003866737D|nr:hypothetical protein OG799_16805 [Micromonospora sp. NBC_00898]